jgi:hypothetical protein
MQDLYFSEEQYREALDELLGDGYSNEYQRASAESLMLRGGIPNQTAKAHELTLAGKFVVLCHWPFYCNVTSAILGEGVTIDVVFDSEADALAFEAQEAAQRHECDEAYSAIYRIPTAPAPYVADPDDDLPF